MKRHTATKTLITTCGLALLSTFAARAQVTPFYLKADAGGAWTPDTQLKEFFGENTTGVKVAFDPGYRFGLVAGYQVTDWFATEFETGVTANRIRSITDASVDDAILSNVPFLLNVRLQCPALVRFWPCPYIGGGLGGSAAVIDADHIDFGLTRMHGSQSDAVFAYQAFGGLRCNLNDHLGISLEYHYFATSDPEWKADSTTFTGSDRMRFGGTETHSVSLAIEFRF
ncbi:MAG: outer membrane beta-barrel protein [Verrucomicrobiota bacterium]|jgi:opacity protein-like surface antigen